MINIFSCTVYFLKCQFHCLAFSGRNIQRKCIGFQNNAVLFQSYNKGQVICICKEISIFYGKHSILNRHSDVGVKSLHFLNLWRIGAIGIDHTIGAESIIAWSVLKISAISQNRFPVVIFGFDCLIDVVPDETTLISLIFVLKVSVKAQTAKRIAHSVHILTADIRSAVILFQVFFHFLRFCVHTAFHIRDRIILMIRNSCNALIVHQSCRVYTSEIFRHCSNIFSAVGFVSARPDENACVILVTFIHRFCSVQYSFFPFWK